MIELRPQQVKTLDVIWDALHSELNVLLQAPCSFGKTVVFAKLIQRLLGENPSFRALILVDRNILVTQSRDKLLMVAPEFILDTGIVCASVDREKVTHKRVTIASRQSLVNKLHNFPPPNLIICDEAHLMAIPNGQPPDQFGEIIAKIREYNPNTRLLGVTATPYRLVDGWIAGIKNKPGSRPYFSEIHHRVTVGELQVSGYLAPLTGKTIPQETLMERLDRVSLVAGEYNLGQTSAIMQESIQLGSAVHAYKDFAINRKKTIVYCVTIEHAEKMAAAFKENGINAIAIHSEVDDIDSYVRMKELEDPDSGVKVFTSVGQLTTGMDVPSVDCIILARPTKSTALYAQILGRGQRLFHDKTDCLVIDLVGANTSFGTDLDNLTVKYNEGRIVGEKKELTTEKTCPGTDTNPCGAVLHIAVRICPECGYSFGREYSDENMELIDAEYGIVPPKMFPVVDGYVHIHTSKKSGTDKRLLQIKLEIDDGRGDIRKPSASIWLCFPDYYTGFAVSKAKKVWERLFTDIKFPATVDEAYAFRDQIIFPHTVTVVKNGKYWNIIDFAFNETPF